MDHHYYYSCHRWINDTKIMSFDDVSSSYLHISSKVVVVGGGAGDANDSDYIFL